MRLIEGETQAEHPGPLLPAIHQRAALRAIEREIPQDREAVGMLTGGLDGQLVGIGIPSRRMDHRCVDACGIHLSQCIVLGIHGNLAMGRIGRDAFCPDMNLRIDNQHGVPLLCFDMVYLSHAKAMLLGAVGWSWCVRTTSMSHQA